MAAHKVDAERQCVPVDAIASTGFHHSSNRAANDKAVYAKCCKCGVVRVKGELVLTYSDGNRYRCRKCYKDFVRRKAVATVRGHTNKMMSRIKARCREVGLPYDLEDHRDKLVERIGAKRCEISGLKLRFAGGVRGFDTVSIDRIVPELGYVYSNIRIVCFALNVAFGDWGEETFRTVVETWLNNAFQHGNRD